MTRRALLHVPGFLLARAAHGQAPYPGTVYRDYARILPDFLRELAREAYEKRNREIARLTTPAAIETRKRWVRDTFWQLVGGIPERTPLKARSLGSFERPGYVLEKVLYESRPQLHVPANLYIPTTAKPPFPGVLFQMGHTLNGKAGETYQKCCQGLARLGYLVLAFDPMGQGERTYYPRPGGYLTRLSSADDEHTVPGRQMLLTGDTASRMQVWDAVRSLDYLAAHPLVDPKRLGTTGQSGGGTISMLLAAVDDRLAAAAVSCGNTENFACADFRPPGSTDDAEQNFVGAGPLGFDRWDLLYPLAPRPLLVLASAKDFFGTYSPSYIASGWEEFQKLQRVYETLSKPDQLRWADTPLPHGLAYYPRLEIYNWFGRWLKGESTPVVEEPDVAVEPDEKTWVAPSGNVVRDFGSLTPFAMNRVAAVALAPAAKADLARLLVIDHPGQDARPTMLRRVPSRGIEIEALEFPAARGTWIPAWLFLPRRPAPDKPLIIALEPAGRNQRWGEEGLWHALASEGHIVCAPDLRGSGDLSPEIGPGAPRYTRPHNDEEHYAWASMMLGKPLVGQRASDLLAVVAAIGAHEAARDRRLIVAASGKMTVPALFAAALDRRIDSLYLAGGLVSFRNLVETEEYTHPFANFVPSLLRYTDLPAVAASIAPRRVRLAGAVDGAGKRLEAGRVREAHGAAQNVTVIADPLWNLEAFRAL